MDVKPVAVFGAGAWGTALALQIQRNGFEVMLWGRDRAQIDAMRATRANPHYLPGVVLPPELQFTSDLEAAARFAAFWVIVVPSEGFRDVLNALRPFLAPTTQVVSATKGFDKDSGQFLHQVAETALGESVTFGIVSGPTFAVEVARNLPTAMTLAVRDEHLAADLVRVFHGEHLRVYSSTDVIGVQLGGAVKNVLAIAAGISDGLGFGANARAALITRGLAEMMRLGVCLGARTETMMGLAGLGDLVLTCTDDKSRNRRFGLALGQGKTAEQARIEIGQVVEGAVTARMLNQIAQRVTVEMPIAKEVFRILYEGLSPATAVNDLLGRRLRSEF
ncbi:MAG: NAD(P)H-dependent glycerol-3-phosphate dehydrogenase [Thiotrichales bacterium]